MPEKQKKKTTVLVVTAVVLALLCGLLLGLLLPRLKTVRLFRGSDTVRCAERNFTVSQTTFAYHYWTEYYYFSDVYGEYLGTMFDRDKPLSEQQYSDTQTWQDYMIERTVTTIREMSSMVFAAEDAGYTMSEDTQKALADVEQGFRDAAQQQGFSSLDAYLVESYGSGAEEASFFAYLSDAHLAADYAEYLKNRISPDEQTVSAYYEAHKDAYADEENPLEAAKSDFIDEEYRNVFLSITEAYTFEVDYENIAAAIAKAD